MKARLLRTEEGKGLKAASTSTPPNLPILPTEKNTRRVSNGRKKGLKYRKKGSLPGKGGGVIEPGKRMRVKLSKYRHESPFLKKRRNGWVMLRSSFEVNKIRCVTS